MARELEEYEGKLSDEEKKDREKNGKRINALNKRKEQLIKDKKKKQEEKLAALKEQGASQEDQDKILAEFERDLQKVQNQMDADRLRMQSELEERIKKAEGGKTKGQGRTGTGPSGREHKGEGRRTEIRRREDEGEEGPRFQSIPGINSSSNPHCAALDQVEMNRYQ
nr:uncharacterized protein LOC129267232 [Lytechinus pictus]